MNKFLELLSKTIAVLFGNKADSLSWKSVWSCFWGIWNSEKTYQFVFSHKTLYCHGVKFAKKNRDADDKRRSIILADFRRYVRYRRVLLECWESIVESRLCTYTRHFSPLQIIPFCLPSTEIARCSTAVQGAPNNIPREYTFSLFANFWQSICRMQL